MENQEQNNKPIEYTNEQKEFFEAFLEAYNVYYDALSEGKIEKDVFEKKHNQIIAFGEKLKEMGFVPENFALWNKLNGSSGHKNLLFDTPNGDIEKFIREIFDIKD